MKKTTIAITAVCLLLAAITLLIQMWFHGYFDHGNFEIKQAQWSSSTRVAVVAERYDQEEALGGLTYFVLIGDHLFTRSELRRAYHSDAPVFATLSNCIDLRWQGPKKLVIACHGPTIVSGFIDVQKRQSGDISIVYEDIPTKNTK